MVFSKLPLPVAFNDCTAQLHGPVTVSVAKVPFGYLVRPKEPHYTHQFETFFGLGCGNLGFSTERTVFVSNGKPSRSIF